MCGSYELKADFDQLPTLLKDNVQINLKMCYEQQPLIKPNDPVIVLLKENSKIISTLMLWGLLAEWSKDPLQSPRSFNARSESISCKPTFRTAWRHRRCLLPASGFFEKSYRIRKASSEPFWLAGLWNKWLGSDGSEIQTCTVITTQANSFIKHIHHRMPVVIPQGSEEIWMSGSDLISVKLLESFFKGWDPDGWLIESLKNKKSNNIQMKLFE